jgi:hypothetical protein
MVLRAAIIVGFPKKTPQPATSIDGIQRAAGRPSINTVIEPTAIGVPNGGVGTGGWIGPAAVTPVQAAMSPTRAAGSPSIKHIEGFGNGVIAPQGVIESCVSGSPILAAGPGGIWLLLIN